MILLLLMLILLKKTGKIGVNVDDVCCSKQNICDEEITWAGSLNPLNPFPGFPGLSCFICFVLFKWKFRRCQSNWYGCDWPMTTPAACLPFAEVVKAANLSNNCQTKILSYLKLVMLEHDFTDFSFFFNFLKKVNH